jgi:hypothetical protein
MFYPYDPKRLTLQDKEDAQLLVDELNLTGIERTKFIDGFYCGIQNRERQMNKRRQAEEED